jgi:hypothetical protein
MIAVAVQVRCVKADTILWPESGMRSSDAIMKEFFAGRLLARPLAAGEVVFEQQRKGSSDCY